MTAALEDIKTLEIEEWKTLNTAASSTKLPIGHTPDAKNVWVDEKPGSVITANGYQKVGTIPSGNPASFCIDFFKASSGAHLFVVSDNSTVWTTLDFQTFTSIITGLSSTYQLRGKVIRDKLWLTNGIDSVRTYDGSTVTALDGTASTPAVPKGRFIEYHDERVWMFHIPSNRSQSAFSALTDSSGTIIAPDTANAWPSSNTLQVSEGDADFGTALLVYRGYLHFFKQYSIWRLVGYDEYTYSRVKTRASTGTRFSESVQVHDNVVKMIGNDGIYTFDGEITDRISDIIDPSAASQTAFGFNQLQQPNTNTRFFEVAATADWNAGTVMRNCLASDELRLDPSDDSQADFQAGTLTNMDATSLPGSVQLGRLGTGGSSERVGLQVGGYLDDSGNAATVYGDPSYLCDGNISRETGLGVLRSSINRFVVDLSADKATHYDIGKIIVRGIQGDTAVTAFIQVNTGAYQTRHGTEGTWVSVGSFPWLGDAGTHWTPFDSTQSFIVKNAIQVSLLFTASGGSFQVSEIEAYTPAFQLTGNIISQSLDYGAAPVSFGSLYASLGDTTGGPANHGATFYTQSSADGITWDAEVAVTMSAITGGAINSTPKRYLRWRGYFTSDGTSTYFMTSVVVGGQYLSAIHDTGGNIFAWGTFEAESRPEGQTIKFYCRTATTSLGIAATAWSEISPGGVIADAVSRQFVQFKIEILGGTPLLQPVVLSVTVSWVVGTGLQPQTLQNVCSAVWRNRYWLSAAGPSATSNDTILILGKKTFASPWQLKDWSILSFCKFQDRFYGCSSVDGSIYRLDTGYSKNGSALDSYFETGDTVVGGFWINIVEVLIEVERTGGYSLSVGLSRDRGETWTEKTVDLSVNGTNPSYFRKLNFGFTCDKFRLRVRINGTDSPFEVHRAIVYYKVSAARGSIN